MCLIDRFLNIFPITKAISAHPFKHRFIERLHAHTNTPMARWHIKQHFEGAAQQRAEQCGNALQRHLSAV
ncbi:MAG: hypothetical protein AB1489_37185 [Acidobacteriota bacterium]